MTTVFDNPLTGYRLVDTQFGDTLQKIAFRELGDATLWAQLIAYNNLIYPYLTDDPTQVATGVILTGGQILVPAAVPLIDAATDPTEVFETDVALDVSGFLDAGADGDLTLVSGVDNLTQAIQNRIDTDIGELIFHNTYGTRVRELIGAMNGPNVGLLAGAYVASALILDDRIASVDQATVTVSGDTTAVAVTATPVVGRQVQLATTL